jgi:hypothetical protein
VRRAASGRVGQFLRPEPDSLSAVWKGRWTVGSGTTWGVRQPNQKNLEMLMNAMFFGAVGRFVRSLPFCRCRALGRRFNLVLFALPILTALFLLSCVAPTPDYPEVERAPEA